MNHTFTTPRGVKGPIVPVSWAAAHETQEWAHSMSRSCIRCLCQNSQKVVIDWKIYWTSNKWMKCGWMMKSSSFSSSNTFHGTLMKARSSWTFRCSWMLCFSWHVTFLGTFHAPVHESLAFMNYSAIMYRNMWTKRPISEKRRPWPSFHQNRPIPQNIGL